LTIVDITGWWRDDWKMALVGSSSLVDNPVSPQLSFDSPVATWGLCSMISAQHTATVVPPENRGVYQMTDVLVEKSCK